MYESVAKAFDNDDDCVVAQMDADNADNRPIAQEYEVQSFPTIKFFPKGSTSPEPYTSGRSEENFIQFLNSKCGLQRVAGGGLSELAGRIPSLDAIASKFYASVGASGQQERTTLLEKAKQAVLESSSLDKDKTANYYVRVMDKLNVDPSYVTRESSRLKKILDKHAKGTSQLASRKVDEITKKANILASFALQQVVEGAQAVKEQAQKVRDEL